MAARRAAAELVRQVKEKFPHSVPGTGWGMTEVSGAFTGIQAEDYLLRPDSCGPAIPVGDMKIADANGHALPAGSVGELWVKGPNVVRGYWRNPKATAETFVDGWLRTGDIARLDDEGFCYILDRAKDMLIRGGENIYCIEVESALFEHPAVIDAAVVAVPHRTLGEEPGAVVTLKEGVRASEDELRAFVAERLAAFKVPVKSCFPPTCCRAMPPEKCARTSSNACLSKTRSLPAERRPHTRVLVYFRNSRRAIARLWTSSGPSASRSVRICA